MDISLLKSSNYPYHLTWEELNNPGMVLQSFIKKWDLQYSRVLLKRWQASLAGTCLIEDEASFHEMKFFLCDFEKLIEAVFVLRMQFDVINSNTIPTEI